jgi:O6-methylguanine-DNA--protein-cysteine methyltransferase
MLRVNIIKNGQVTHLAEFNTQAEADAWIAEGSKQQWWGKPAYTEVIPAKKELQEVVVQPRIVEQQEVVITPEVRDEDCNIITPAITEMQEVVIQEEIKEMQLVEIEPEKTIEHPAEFEVQIEDITEEINFQKKVDKNLRRIQFGQRLMAEFAADNQADLESDTLTLSQVIEMEAALATIQRLILNGSLGLALSAMISTSIPHLSQEKLQKFIQKIENYLAQERE